MIVMVLWWLAYDYAIDDDVVVFVVVVTSDGSSSCSSGGSGSGIGDDDAVSISLSVSQLLFGYYTRIGLLACVWVWLYVAGRCDCVLCDNLQAIQRKKR